MTHPRLPNVISEIEDLNNARSTVIFRANKDAFTQAMHRIKPLKALPYQTRPAMERVAEYVRTVMIPRTFAQEGPGWQKLAPMTMGQRMAQGYPPAHPILYREGDLYRELTEKSHPKHIEIIKVGRLARIEVGGSSQKFIENQTGTGHPNLPARPMIPGTGNLPVPDADRKQMKQIILEELLKRMTVFSAVARGAGLV